MRVIELKLNKLQLKLIVGLLIKLIKFMLDRDNHTILIVKTIKIFKLKIKVYLNWRHQLVTLQPVVPLFS